MGARRCHAERSSSSPNTTLDLGRVPLPEGEVVEGQLELDVAHERDHHGVAPDLLLVLGQVLAELRGLLGHVAEDAVEVAVGAHELGRGLLPHPGHAGQVVRTVAAQGGEHGVGAGGHPVALDDAGLVVDDGVGDAPAGVHDLDERVLDQLERVAVPAHHHHVAPGVARPGGQGGEDVVGLVAGLLDHHDTQGPQHVAHHGELGHEEVGGIGAVALVLLHDVVAKRWLGAVEGHRHAAGLVVAQEHHQHRGEPVHGVGDLARLGGQVDGEGEERPEDEGVAVEQVQVAGVGPWKLPLSGILCAGGAAPPGAEGRSGGDPALAQGVSVPSMISWATTCIRARRSMAVRWMKEKATSSAMP